MSITCNQGSHSQNPHTTAGYVLKSRPFMAIGDFLLFGGGGGKLVGCFVFEIGFTV